MSWVQLVPVSEFTLVNYLTSIKYGNNTFFSFFFFFFLRFLGGKVAFSSHAYSCLLGCVEKIEKKIPDEPLYILACQNNILRNGIWHIFIENYYWTSREPQFLNTIFNNFEITDLQINLSKFFISKFVTAKK